MMQMERDLSLKEINRVNKLNLEIFQCCQAQYNQSDIYHKNFKSLEKEFTRLLTSTQGTINDCMSLVQRSKKENG